MKEQIIAINRILAGHNHVELDVFEYKNNRLVIHVGDDLCYSHWLELVFENIIYFNISPDWHMESNPPEIKIRAVYPGPECVYSCVVLGNDNFYVTAETLTYTSGTVFRYKREKLLPGERIDDRVK